MSDRADLASIEADGRRIIELGRAEPGAMVPQYPTWTLRDLVAHVGEVHGRTLEVCRSRPQERIPGPRPPAHVDVFDWAEGILVEMVAALGAADPESVVWTFVADKRLAVWVRRMVVETGLHRWDAVGTVADPEPLSVLVATSGLDEFGAQYLHRLGALPTIELVDPALGRSWRYGPGEPAAVIVGSASEHYLRLMSRPGSGLPPVWAAAVDALGSPADG